MLRLLFSPNNYNIWNFLVKIAFFIKTINYKTSVKTHIKNILQRTMIVTLLFVVVLQSQYRSSCVVSCIYLSV